MKQSFWLNIHEYLYIYVVHRLTNSFLLVVFKTSFSNSFCLSYTLGCCHHIGIFFVHFIVLHHFLLSFLFNFSLLKVEAVLSLYIQICMISGSLTINSSHQTGSTPTDIHLGSLVLFSFSLLSFSRRF